MTPRRRYWTAALPAFQPQCARDCSTRQQAIRWRSPNCRFLSGSNATESVCLCGCRSRPGWNGHLSNREIGQMLYLSHRTVSSHLYRVFPKLGITSRTEFRAAVITSIPDPLLRLTPAAPHAAHQASPRAQSSDSSEAVVSVRNVEERPGRTTR